MAKRSVLVRLRRFAGSEGFRTAPVQTIWRRLVWRFHWRFRPGEPFVVDIPGGLTVRLAHSSASSGIFMNGGYSDRAVANFFTDALRPGMVCVDCGAHIGEYTLLFARLSQEHGAVHAFEPDPRVFLYLEQNVSESGFANIDCNQLALSDTNGRAGFVLARDPTTSRLDVVGAVDTIVVETQTLDAYLVARHIVRVDALKIDVEGAEEAVVSGAAELLAREPPRIVFIECHGGERAGRLAELLRGYGYDIALDERDEESVHLIARLP